MLFSEIKLLYKKQQEIYMKKYLILSALFVILPSYSACAIDGESVCTLPEFRQQVTPMFKQSTGIQPNIDNTPGQLQPLNRADPINSMRSPNNDLNYNSGCQFGVCLQNPNESRLPDSAEIK